MTRWRLWIFSDDIYYPHEYNSASNTNTRVAGIIPFKVMVGLNGFEQPSDLDSDTVFTSDYWRGDYGWEIIDNNGNVYPYFVNATKKICDPDYAKNNKCAFVYACWLSIYDPTLVYYINFDEPTKHKNYKLSDIATYTAPKEKNKWSISRNPNGVIFNDNGISLDQNGSYISCLPGISIVGYLYNESLYKKSWKDSMVVVFDVTMQETSSGELKINNPYYGGLTNTFEISTNFNIMPYAGGISRGSYISMSKRTCLAFYYGKQSDTLTFYTGNKFNTFDQQTSGKEVSTGPISFDAYNYGQIKFFIDCKNVVINDICILHFFGNAAVKVSDSYDTVPSFNILPAKMFELGTTASLINTTYAPASATFSWAISNTGTFTTRDVSWKPTKPGIYTIALNYNNNVVSKNAYVMNCAFTYVIKGKTVTFTNTSTTTGDSTFSWDFGDGSTSNTSYTVNKHTYISYNVYKVTLTHYCGDLTMIYHQTVTVFDIATVDFTWVPRFAYTFGRTNFLNRCD